MLRVKVQLAAWVVWAICDETWPNALPIGYVIRPKSIDDPNRQKPLDVLCMIAVCRRIALSLDKHKGSCRAWAT